MLACCSPSSHHLDETANTLHFASRAKNIANRPVVRESGAPMLLQMQQAMRALQEENASLRNRLEQQQQRQSPPPAAVAPSQPPVRAPQPSQQGPLETAMGGPASQPPPHGHTSRATGHRVRRQPQSGPSQG